MVTTRTVSVGAGVGAGDILAAIGTAIMMVIMMDTMPVTITTATMETAPIFTGTAIMLVLLTAIPEVRGEMVIPVVMMIKIAMVQQFHVQLFLRILTNVTMLWQPRVAVPAVVAAAVEVRHQHHLKLTIGRCLRIIQMADNRPYPKPLPQ